MKVLMTADTAGGVWTYAMELCAALSARDVRVTLVTLGGPMSPDQRRTADACLDLQVIEVECKLEWMDDPWDDVIRSSEVLLDTALGIRPDVVHLSSFAHASLPWRSVGVPSLLVGHSCVETWWRAVKGRSAGDAWQAYRDAVAGGIHDADVFVAPTRAMLDAFGACYGPRRDGRVIHNGRSVAAARTHRGPKQPWVLTAGRLWDQAKNVAALEAAAPSIRWPVRIAGDGRPPGKAAANVTHLGPLPSAEMAMQMTRASIYALPAKYEPFGLSALEAALCGCALVLGRIDSLAEVWGDAAVYADPDDPEALAGAINELIDDPARLARFAAAAHRRAQRYTPQRMAGQYLQLYRDMTRPRRRADRRVEQGVPA